MFVMEQYNVGYPSGVPLSRVYILISFLISEP